MAYFKPYFDKQFKNRAELTESVDTAVKSYVERFRKKSMPVITNDRSLLDRTLDVLSTPNYAIAGAIKGLVDNKSEENVSPIEGFVGGLRAGNPLGKGYEKGEIVFSDVLHELGWQPEGTGGKVTRGVVGFALDVLFDPLTYVTGGLAGVVKGTGKTGKLAKNAITLDDAVKIVGDINKSKYLNMSTEAIQSDARKVYEMYNKLGGLNRVARDVTLSLGNMPFGKKIFGELADKKITLASGKSAQALGDETIAPYYAKLRDAIYGSKFGDVFSTSSKLYKLSKEDPAKLYDIIQAAEKIRGLGLDKRAIEKMIRDKGKMFADLTPDESKQLLEIMENPSLWIKVQKTMKFLETQEGKRYHAGIAAKQKATQTELNHLKEIKNNIDNIMKSGEEGIIKAQDELNVLRNEYREAIKNFDANNLSDMKQLKSFMKMYQAELDDIIAHEKLIDKEKMDNFLKHYDEYVAGKNITKGQNELLDKINSNPRLEYNLKRAMGAYDKAVKSGNVNNIKKWFDRVDEIKKQIKEFEDSITKSTKKAVKTPNKIIKSADNQIKIDEYDTKINLLADDLQKMNRTLKKQKGSARAKTEQNMIKLLKEFTTLKKQRNDFVKTLDKLVMDEVVIDEAVVEIMNIVKAKHIPDNSTVMYSTVLDDLSELVFNEKGRIDSRVYKTEIDAITKMLRDGKSKEDIIRYVNDNIDVFSGKTPRINNFIASEVGYKNWDELNKTQTAKLKELKKTGTPKEVEEFEKEFTNMIKKRNALKAMFNPHQTKEEVDEIIRNYHSRKNGDEFLGEMMDEGMETRRAKMNDHDFAIVDKKIGVRKVFTKEQQKKIDRIDDVIKRFAELDKSGRFVKFKSNAENKHKELVKQLFKQRDEIVSQYNIDTVKAQIKDRRYSDMIFTNKRFTDEDFGAIRSYLKSNNIDDANLDLFTKEMVAVLTKLFKKDYSNMKFSSLNAIRNKNVKTGKLNTMSQRDVVLSKAFKQAKDNINKMRVRNFIKSGNAKKQRLVEFTKQKINSVKQLSKIDVKQDVLSRKDELVKLIGESKKKINELNVQKKGGKKHLADLYESRISETVKHISDLENTQKTLYDAMKSEDMTKIDKLTNDLKKLDEILIDDEAFESYAKTKLDSKFDKVLSKNKADTGMIVLDTRLDLSDKVKEIAKVLREDFIKIGSEEVGIRKLSREQFDAMMWHYLPHIITPEGAKWFRENGKMLAEKGVSFGDMYGFGKKSYNPHAKSRIKYFPKRIDEATGKVLEWYVNPTIEQVNEFMKPFLKGKSFFSENIADIWIARATKHLDLMYDNKYMRTMMDEFGKNIGKNGVEKGCKAVANYGLLREHVYSKALKLAKQEVKKTKGDLQEALENQISKVLDGYKLPKDILNDLAVPMVELNADQILALKNTRLVKQVNEVIVDRANQARKIQIAKDQSDFLKLVDKITRLIKFNQTAVMPVFHIRNFLSNKFNNSFAIGADVLDVEMQKLSWKTVKARGDIKGIKDMKPISIKRPDGTVEILHWDEVYEMTKQYSVVDEGFFAKDIGAGSATTGILPRINPKYDPTDTKNFIGYKVGTNFGSQIENSDRLLHFVAQLKRGLTPEQAAASVNRFLFDYSDLTAFEQNVMKRLIPYYTWLRKNAPLQLEMMIEYPERYAMIAKMEHGVEHMTSRDERVEDRFLNDFAKDWVQMPFNVTNEKGRKEPVLFNPNLPFMDIGRIPDVSQPINSLKEIFTQTNSLIKVPIEQIINRNVFFDQPIVEESDSQLKCIDHVLSQLAPYAAGKGFATKRGVDLGLHALNQFTGVKMLSYDYEAYKPLRYKQLLDEYYKKKKFKRDVTRGFNKVVDSIITGFNNQVSKAIDYVNEGRPDSAFDYDGALRPISQTTYEDLSDEEKLKYMPPTQDEAVAYHKKAVELAEQEYQKSNVVKRFVWSMFDKLDLKDKKFLGRVTRVVDGDTFEVQIGDKKETVRMLLVDTPESTGEYKDNPMPYGKEASEHTKKSLIDKDVKIYFDGDERDKYDRILGYIEVDDKDYNEELLKKGYAQLRYLFQDRYKRLDKYREAENKAYENKSNIWSLNGYATLNSDDGWGNINK